MIAVMPLSAQIRIGFARIGWAHVEALVVPLVLQRIALRDGGDASIERGQCGSIVAATDGGIGGQKMHVVTRAGKTRSTFGDGKQYRGTGALRQTGQQGHGQGLDAEQRRECAFAGLRPLIGQDADPAAGMQGAQQTTYSIAARRYLGAAGAAAIGRASWRERGCSCV